MTAYTFALRAFMAMLGFTLAWSAFEATTLALKIMCWFWVALVAISLTQAEFKARNEQ